MNICEENNGLTHLARDQEVGFVLHRTLERVALVCDKIKVHCSTPTGIVGILDEGRVHVDEPAFPPLTLLHSLKTKFGVYFVAQTHLLETFCQLRSVVFALRGWSFC